MSKSEFTRVERLMARAAKRFPYFKYWAKTKYLRLGFLISGGRKKSDCQYELRRWGLKEKESFFGYFDLCPQNEEGQVLVHSSSLPTHQAPTSDPIEVLVLASDGTKLVSVETKAYNWQQGARAQWLSEDEFIFNDCDLGSQMFLSKVFSLKRNCVVREFSLAHQISSNKGFSLGLNYRRLASLRPDYGYHALGNLATDVLKNTADDGVFYLDHLTGKTALIYSLEELIYKNWKTEFKSAFHKVNHFSLSPDESRFLFVHRAFLEGRRFDQLFLGMTDGSGLSIISDFGMVSHYCWVDDNVILGYLRGPTGEDRFWLIDLKTMRWSAAMNAEVDAFGDGHPSCCGSLILADTYPNRARLQKLYLWDSKLGQLKILGEFFSDLKYYDVCRCDLHPRFSLQGNRIFFDSVFEGRRGLFSIDLR